MLFAVEEDPIAIHPTAGVKKGDALSMTWRSSPSSGPPSQTSTLATNVSRRHSRPPPLPMTSHLSPVGPRRCRELWTELRKSTKTAMTLGSAPQNRLHLAWLFFYQQELKHSRHVTISHRTSKMASPITIAESRRCRPRGRPQHTSRSLAPRPCH